MIIHQMSQCVTFYYYFSLQVIFEGRRGTTELSDVAVDDISLYRGSCAGVTTLLTVLNVLCDLKEGYISQSKRMNQLL